MSYVMLIKYELNPVVNRGYAITSAQMKMAELDAIKKIIVTWRVRWMCREQHSESETWEDVDGLASRRCISETRDAFGRQFPPISLFKSRELEYPHVPDSAQQHLLCSPPTEESRFFARSTDCSFILHLESGQLESHWAAGTILIRINHNMEKVRSAKKMLACGVSWLSLRQWCQLPSRVEQSINL